MTQRGKYDLRTDKGTQTLHFSANCWYNLLEDTGKQSDEFSVELGTAFSEEPIDTLKVLNLLTDLAFAAAKAYDQEEGNDITYTRFKVRDWMAGLKEADSEHFVKAMTGSNDIPIVKGKKD